MARLLGAWLLMLTVPVSVLEIRALDGTVVRPLAPAGAANVLFFVASDCPISNHYAPEIQNICSASESRGVGCTLVYEETAARAGSVRDHLREFGYRGITAAIDADGHVAAALKASITPEAVLVDRGGVVRYRGRIDNLYADLGKPRQVVTSHDLRDAIAALLAGTPITRPETSPIGCFIVPPSQRRS